MDPDSTLQQPDSKQVRADHLQLLFQQSHTAAYTSPLVAFVLVLALWSVQDQQLLVMWLGAVLLVSGVRVAVFQAYFRYQPADRDVDAWEWAYFGPMLVYFLVWGIGALWLMPDESPLYRAVILYFLIGMAGSAIAVLSANRRFLLCAVAALLVPALLHLFRQGDHLAVMMGVAGLFFVLSAIRSSGILSHAMTQNLRLNGLLAKAKEEAELLARVDELTGLHNRRSFLELGREHLRTAGDAGAALVMFDLDHFKQINDCYGHPTGDEVLRRLAKDIAGRLRSDDVFARLGGEEFGIVMPRTPLHEALALAETLRESITNRDLDLERGSIALSASFGVAYGTGDLDQLILLADEALYQAKNGGRNCVRLAQPPEVNVDTAGASRSPGD